MKKRKVILMLACSLVFVLCASGQTKNVALSTTVKWDDATPVAGKVVLSRTEPCSDPTAVNCYAQLANKPLSSGGYASFTVSGEKNAIYRVDLILTDGTPLAIGVFSFALLDDAAWNKLTSAKDSLIFRLADRSKKQEQFTFKYGP